MATRLIRKLTSDEIQFLQEELRNNDSLWTTHSSLMTTALKDGTSIHVNFVSNDLYYRYSNFHLFPRTHEMLQEIAENKVIARCYWHKLLPGDTIRHHDDTDPGFVKRNELYARYQIYLDCSNKSAVIDNAAINISDYEYSLVDFDLRLPHSYRNGSDSHWVFLVFDVLHAGIELKQ
jgi:hypothetical protein